MDRIDKISYLKKSFAFWNNLSDEDRKAICENSKEVTYKKGTNIHDGEECTGVILVKTGSLRLYMMSEEGKEITLYRLFPGDICMLSASCVIQSITFDVAVDAEEDSECILISGSVFARLSERIPEIKIFALETAISRFSDVMWVMQQILFMSFDRRLAIFLLDESSKNGTDTIKLTHEQIAKYMGTAREVVSRMLKYFVSEGLVESSRSEGIKLIDKNRLRALVS
jgi:CRP/FNR family transcriptional regulator